MAYPDVLDLDRLLRYFRDLHAHSMTLEQMLLLPESDMTEAKYNELRPQNDLRAEQDFELLFHGLHDPTGFAAALTAFQNTHPRKGKAQ